MSLQAYGEKWVDVDGIRTRYFEAGQGRPVVLIHGGQAGEASGGASAEDFELNFGDLAEHFRVIAVDRLGQGYTGNPTNDEDWTMAASVRHIAGFLRTLDVGPYNLVGHSGGGYVAARIALDHPERVESCVAIDSNTAAPGAGRNEAVLACNPHPRGTIEAARYIYEQFSYDADHVTDAWIAMKQKIAESEKNKQAVAKMSGEGFMATRFIPELSRDTDAFFTSLKTEGIKRPVMLIWGYNNPTAPVELGLRLYDLIAIHQPRTQFHILNEAGHQSFREQPTEFNRVVREFVEGVAHGN